MGPRATGANKPSPLPEESPRRTSRACSQGPRLWTEEVILAPKPLAPFSPRDLFLVTPGPVNRTFCPHQPAPPTPFWGRGPEQVFSAFQGNGSHPGARTRKCWKPRENADCRPPPIALGGLGQGLRIGIRMSSWEPLLVRGPHFEKRCSRW